MMTQGKTFTNFNQSDLFFRLCLVERNWMENKRKEEEKYGFPYLVTKITWDLMGNGRKTFI